MKTNCKTKLLSLLLVLVMVLAAIPFSVLPAWADEPEITEVGTWGELLAAVNSDKTHIKLKNNIEDIVPDDELPTKHRLVFNGGMDYILDLNGYELKVLNHINEFYSGEFSMIEVSNSSKLEIKDGSLIFDNYSTKANRKAKGVVAVKDDSTLTAIDVNMQNKYTGTVVYANSSAKVTLDGGEYAVQNGFAIYLENQASLTLDGPYIHTTMGDGTPTQYVDGYGALYSESKGELVINDAFFKSGVQVSSSQIDAFSIATHEVTVNGQVLTEDIFVGTNFEAKQQNKAYYWYSWTGYSLTKTDNSSFTNPVRVISYEKKYPVTVESGIAMVGGKPVTEASYGQEVTVVAHTPEEGMEFLRWDTSGVLLADDFSASTTFTMVPAPVTLAAYYGKEAVKSVSVTVDDLIPGQSVNDTKITLENGVILQAVEWREESALKGDYAVFRAGKSHSVKILVYPPEGNKFGDTVTATVNGKNATVTATSQYAYIDYTFEATPSVGFSIVYDTNNSQLGVGGNLLLDTALMADQSAEFKSALDAGKVTYQWYRNGEAIEGATDAVYNFTAEDVAGIFYVAVTADGKSNYGHNVTCSGDLYQVYLNASDIVAGGKAPQMSVATPGISIDTESMAIYEILGNNSYGNPQSVANSILIPGKSYLIVGKIIEQDGVTVAYGANVYVNDELMKDKLDARRFFYEFTVPEADFPVYYKANGEIGIGVTLTVDIEKMCNENGTFKHAYEAANPTYQTVFYQWYKNGEAIKNATDPSYTVKTTDKDSYIHCKVTLVDGKYGIGEQHVITNVITVLNVKMSYPKNGETRLDSGISADGVSLIGIMWWPEETGNTMNGDDTYVEGIVYEYYIQFQAKEGFSLDFNGDMTIAYIYGQKVDTAGSVPNSGKAFYTGKVTAIHKHQYSDTVWDHDEYGHWQPCIVSGCPDPNEEWEMYTEHTGGTATCQTKGECAICGAEYLADHDFSVPDYQYVDDMKCANFCENCDVYSDWSYHEGGVATCKEKSVCEICHHEYGKLAECAGGTATCTEKATCATCGEKYGELAEHAYTNLNGYKGADGHANVCECGAHDTPVAHTPDRAEATETEAVKCSDCGYIITPALGHTTHTPKDEWKSDGQNHWHECTGCEGQELDKAAHADSNDDGKCDTCDYTMSTDIPDDPEIPTTSEDPEETETLDVPQTGDGDKGGMGAGAVIGIVIASLLVVGVGGFAVVWFGVKKKSFADLKAVFKKK